MTNYPDWYENMSQEQKKGFGFGILALSCIGTYTVLKNVGKIFRRK